jgi:hypothetical protein
MRKLLIAATAIALAAPAAAQPSGHDREDDIVEVLPDRREMAAMTGSLDRLVGALLDLPIGGIVAAVDPEGRGGYRRADRLRDLSDDPYVEERLRGTIRGTSAGMGAMVEAMAVMTPVLRRSLEDARRRMEDAIEGSRYRD